MKTLDSTQLLFPQSTNAKFLLYSCGSKIGEIALPQKGITFFPPERKSENDKLTLIFHIRLNFADGEQIEDIRRVVQFSDEDPWRHKIRLVIPGENPAGYEVKPYGNWKAWFFDDIPQGYGPVEMQFISEERPNVASSRFCEAFPWVVE